MGVAEEKLQNLSANGSLVRGGAAGCAAGCAAGGAVAADWTKAPIPNEDVITSGRPSSEQIPKRRFRQRHET
jgi:hypothetical protein